MVQKACKSCKTIFEGPRCTNCGSEEFTDTFKGKLIVIDSEKSEIAQKLKISKKGVYAFKLG